jgi:hypothetical protein
MSVADLDVVAEDFVEADLQGRDARFADELRLVLDEPLLGVGADVAEAV